MFAYDEEFSNKSIYDIFVEMAPNLNFTLKKCIWTADGGTCSDLYVPIATERGICFAFNALNSNDMYTDK